MRAGCLATRGNTSIAPWTILDCIDPWVGLYANPPLSPTLAASDRISVEGLRASSNHPLHVNSISKKDPQPSQDFPRDQLAFLPSGKFFLPSLSRSWHRWHHKRLLLRPNAHVRVYVCNFRLVGRFCSSTVLAWRHEFRVLSVLSPLPRIFSSPVKQNVIYGKR